MAKTILITGASSGIGRQTAILFSQKGWNVAAADRDQSTKDPIVHNIHTYFVDVRQKQSIEDCISRVLSDFEQIDAIVNCAGIYFTSPLECISTEKMNSIIETNINGVLYMTQAILPHFRQNGAGVIVNISSILGRVTLPFQSVYHTSKWAVEGLSESLYYELKNLNIRIKIIEPGIVKTNLYQSVLQHNTAQYPAIYKNNFEQWHKCLIAKYENGYSPELEAKTIFRAVNDHGSKFRYTSDLTTKMLIGLRAILPLWLFRRIIYSMSKLQ